MMENVNLQQQQYCMPIYLYMQQQRCNSRRFVSIYDNSNTIQCRIINFCSVRVPADCNLFTSFSMFLQQLPLYTPNCTQSLQHRCTERAGLKITNNNKSTTRQLVEFSYSSDGIHAEWLDFTQQRCNTVPICKMILAVIYNDGKCKFTTATVLRADLSLYATTAI